MKQICKTTLVFSFVILNSCAHQGVVHPGADGIHKSFATGETKDIASEKAYTNSDNFCKEHQLRSGIVNTQLSYHGKQDEVNYLKSLTGFGSQDQSLKSIFNPSPEDKPYHCEISFKCISIK